MSDKRVAVLFAEGFEELEALSVCDILWRSNVSCTRVAVGSLRGLVRTSSHGISITCDERLEQIDLADFDMVVLPGGQPGTNNLERDLTVLSECGRRMANDLWLAAICAAPGMLASHGLLANRAVVGHETVRDMLLREHCQIPNAGTVVDRNLITSRGAGTALDFALTIVQELTGDDVLVASVAASIHYKMGRVKQLDTRAEHV